MPIAAGTIPKHLSSALVMLRDARLKPKSKESLQQLAAALTDPNFRIYAESGELHLMNCHGHWHGNDVSGCLSRQFQGLPLPAFIQFADSSAKLNDASHAFYLGYELARAEIALHLGKQYTQDEPMQWGLLGPTRRLIHRRIACESSGALALASYLSINRNADFSVNPLHANSGTVVRQWETWIPFWRFDDHTFANRTFCGRFLHRIVRRRNRLVRIT